MKARLLRVIALLAWLYPAALAVTTLILAAVGDDWWLVGVVHYLPRALFALPLPVIVGALLWARRYRLIAAQAVSAAIVLFPLMGLELPALSQGEGEGPVVRVFSYNVNSAHMGEDVIVGEALQYEPDIIVLQEAAGRAESLAQRLKAHYAYVLASTQFVIATRFPILSTHEPDKIPLNGRQRSPRFISHVLDTSLGKVALYNVHPISPRDGFHAIRGQGLRHEIASGRLFTAENAGDLRVNNRLRREQIEIISREAAAERVPVILAGDTNLPALSPHLRQYLSRYQDGFAQVGWGFGYTFPADKAFAWMRLDRIFASPALRFVAFEVCPSPASDHRCVMADIQRRAQ